MPRLRQRCHFQTISTLSLQLWPYTFASHISSFPIMDASLNNIYLQFFFFFFILFHNVQSQRRDQQIKHMNIQDYWKRTWKLAQVECHVVFILRYIYIYGDFDCTTNSKILKWNHPNILLYLTAPLLGSVMNLNFSRAIFLSIEAGKNNSKQIQSQRDKNMKGTGCIKSQKLIKQSFLPMRYQIAKYSLNCFLKN